MATNYNYDYIQSPPQIQTNIKNQYPTTIKTLNLKNNNNNINNNNIIMNKTINNYSSIIYKFACRTKAGKDLSGQTKTNQDNFLAKNKIFNLLNYSAFAVFDGHGINGHTISKYIKEYFIDFFTSTKKLNIKREKKRKKI